MEKVFCSSHSQDWFLLHTFLKMAKNHSHSEILFRFYLRQANHILRLKSATHFLSMNNWRKWSCLHPPSTPFLCIFLQTASCRHMGLLPPPLKQEHESLSEERPQQQEHERASGHIKWPPPVALGREGVYCYVLRQRSVLKTQPELGTDEFYCG